ncbi:TPA: hypothetical protein ACH3X1_015522 [Trebouxia sp. C0004]
MDYAGRLAEALIEEGPGPSKKSKTGPSSQMLLVDQSHVLIKQLLYDPLPDPALPTNSSQVSEWLFGCTQLKIPVTAIFYQHTSTVSQQQLAPQDDAASAVVTLTELLQTAPRLPYSTEMHTSVYVCNFVGSVWGSLTTHSPTNLKYNLLLNKASQLRNVSSHAIAPKSRPDTMLAAESCTLLLGEDKHIDLLAAYEDLNRKRVDLSGMHYGPLKVAMEGTTVFEQINRFEEYQRRQKTSLAAIRKAYEAADRAASAANLA